jgi:hypothetical protein
MRPDTKRWVDRMPTADSVPVTAAVLKVWLEAAYPGTCWDVIDERGPRGDAFILTLHCTWGGERKTKAFTVNAFAAAMAAPGALLEQLIEAVESIAPPRRRL